jgi:hypothetical protein
MPDDLANMSPERFMQFFDFYTGAPHQKRNIRKLYQRIVGADPTIMREQEDWRVGFSTPDPPLTTNPLDIPYFWQQDNGPDGWRECQGSCIAMGLAFKQVPGIRDDLDYVRIARRFGASRYRATHYKALSHIGFSNFQWLTAWDEASIKREISQGNVICAGIYHHGPVTDPSGGGHFINLIGFDDASRQWIVHDPYGELDLVNGGWASRSATAGRRIRYSYRNLNPRLFHPGPKDGWAWVIR